MGTYVSYPYKVIEHKSPSKSTITCKVIFATPCRTLLIIHTSSTERGMLLSNQRMQVRWKAIALSAMRKGLSVVSVSTAVKLLEWLLVFVPIAHYEGLPSIGALTAIMEITYPG